MSHINSSALDSETDLREKFEEIDNEIFELRVSSLEEALSAFEDGGHSFELLRDVCGATRTLRHALRGMVTEDFPLPRAMDRAIELLEEAWEKSSGEIDWDSPQFSHALQEKARQNIVQCIRSRLKEFIKVRENCNANPPNTAAKYSR